MLLGRAEHAQRGIALEELGVFDEKEVDKLLDGINDGTEGGGQ